MKIMSLSFLFLFAATGFAAKKLTPQEELNRIDKRTPLHLLPMMALHQKKNMQEHLQAVQEILAGLEKTDFASIEEAVKKIGFTEEMGNMCEHMGAASDGFSERAIRFHKTADEIGLAARKKSATEVLAALNRTLPQCTACHAQYRQEIVDEATFKLLSLGKKSHKP